jgi:hypothetical protein
MLLWFIVVAPVIVAEVFRSPMVDYRLVALGAILPLVELAFGRAWVLHTLLAPVTVLTVVMLATVGRRLVRRRLLGIPIGMFLHLALDGSWDRAKLFWWPVFGFDLSDVPVPESQAVWFRLVLELVAVAVAAVAYRRYGLDQAPARERLLRSGHLPPVWRQA